MGRSSTASAGEQIIGRRSPALTRRPLVIGYGATLRRDDGVGVRVAELLAADPRLAGVERPDGAPADTGARARHRGRLSGGLRRCRFCRRAGRGPCPAADVHRWRLRGRAGREQPPRRRGGAARPRDRADRPCAGGRRCRRRGRRPRAGGGPVTRRSGGASQDHGHGGGPGCWSRLGRPDGTTVRRAPEATSPSPGGRSSTSCPAQRPAAAGSPAPSVTGPTPLLPRRPRRVPASLAGPAARRRCRRWSRAGRGCRAHRPARQARPHR